MSSYHKRYRREFKLELVRRVQVTGQSQVEVARELGLAPNTLSRWMRQFRNDNAVMESFCHTLKVERVTWQQYRTKQEAGADLNWWIEVWYSQRRLHSSLGYKSPNEYGREKNIA